LNVFHFNQQQAANKGMQKNEHLKDLALLILSRLYGSHSKPAMLGLLLYGFY
jgi:hypothetical protein